MENKILDILKVCPDDATLLLGQGTVPPWSIVPRAVPGCCNSFQQCRVALLGHLGAIRHCWKLLQHPGAAWNNAPWGHCPLSKEQSSIVWTDLYTAISHPNDVGDTDFHSKLKGRRTREFIH